MARIEMWGVEGIGEVHPGDVLADLIADAITTMASADPSAALRDGDVLVVTQKIVSKAEGRVVAIDPDDPLSHKRLVEEEAVRVVRRRGDLIVTETKHGFVCANAGIDLSNMETGWAALLPLDSDRSARRIRDGLRARLGLHGRGDRVRHVRAHMAQGPHRRRHRLCRRRRRRRPPGHRGRARPRDAGDRGLRRRRARGRGRDGDGQVRGHPRRRRARRRPELAAGMHRSATRSSAARRTTSSAELGSASAGSGRASASRARRPVPASSVVHGFQPRWISARPGSSADRASSPGRAGACIGGFGHTPRTGPSSRRAR